MKMPKFAYAAPATLDEAVALLAADDGARPLSGGQSLFPILAFRLAYPTMLVDLRNIPGLDRIDVTEQGVWLGARVRWAQIEQDERLPAEHPLLREMISHVAHYQIRNRGTVGGSLAHADPAAEMCGLVVVCDCEIVVVGAAGERVIAAADLFAGALETTLEPTEIITGIRFPPWPPGRRWAFLEQARRKGDFAIAGLALHYDEEAAGRAANVHVGTIGVSPTPRRLGGVEALIEGRTVTEDLVLEVKTAASEEVDPMSDFHASAAYRKSLTGTLAARALRRAAGHQLDRLA